MGMKTRRRISDKALADAKAAVRRVFRDAEEEALQALGNSGLEGDGADGTAGMDNGPAGDDDNHIHVHLHQGSEGGQNPAASAGDMPDGGEVADDPVEARFQALEQQHAAILEQLQVIQQQLGGGQPAMENVPSADEGGEMADGEGAAPAPDHEEVPDGGGPADDAGDMPDTKKTADRASVGDSAALATAFAQLVSDAEVLLPGYRVPTMDSALPRSKTIDRMCALRKSVLDSIYLTPSGKSLVDGVSGVADLDTSKMTCGAAAVLFRSAASVKRMLNNRSSTGDASHLPSAAHATPGRTHSTSISALNEANKKFWDARKAAK